MKIILAGHNIDRDIINEFRDLYPQRNDLTPETIAAGYARISRNPAPVNELRVAARDDIEKARLSNKNIVFEMGHSSIAEHAVFNIDVIGVSRLVIEEIERSRLASYTEKSQRYVLLADDFVIPEEIRGTGLEGTFIAAIHRQNAFYHQLYERLRPYVFKKNPELAADLANKSLLEGWAKEDARYCLPLATQTQLGMTINARNIELMIRRLATSASAEARQAGRMLYAAVYDTAPSLVRYTDPTPYDRQSPEVLFADVLRQFAMKTARAGNEKTGGKKQSKGHGDELIRLLSVAPNADDAIAAAMLAGAGNIPFDECLGMVKRMKRTEKEGLFKTVFKEMKAYDSAPREFEHASLTFELAVSATCFAQLKRHRMATISAQPYDPTLGITVPPAIAAIGMASALQDVCGQAAELAGKIGKTAPVAAPYILTNAHRRRVIMTVNAREMYHMSRVRADQSAQWDIRETTAKMTQLAQEAMPLAMMLAAGKDGFNARYKGIFGA
jgi:flavin-dependent thymidylate synthase